MLEVLAQLASALAATHGVGGVHRDVKGDNVLVTASGRAVLLDFGCGIYEGAKVLTDSVLPPGTSSYRTPEALRWSREHGWEGTAYEAGPADDVYALGVTAYRLSTGRYPRAANEDSESRSRPLRPRELATVSEGLEEQMLAALSEDRLARPQASSLANALKVAATAADATVPHRSHAVCGSYGGDFLSRSPSPTADASMALSGCDGCSGRAADAGRPEVD